MATDQVGVEFGSGGHFYPLKVVAGQVVQGQGFDYEGTWSVVDTSGMNGPCSWQLNIDGSLGSTPCFTEFTDAPRKVLLNCFDGVSRYVQIP